MADAGHAPPLPRRARGDTPRLGPGPLTGAGVARACGAADPWRAGTPSGRGITTPAPPGPSGQPGITHPAPRATIAAPAGAGHGHRAEPPAPIAHRCRLPRAAFAVGGSANGAAHTAPHPGQAGSHSTRRARQRGAARPFRRVSQRQGDPCSAGSGKTAAGPAFPHGRDTGQPPESAGQPEGKADAAG